jgi:hypothetical protein
VPRSLHGRALKVGAGEQGAGGPPGAGPPPEDLHGAFPRELTHGLVVAAEAAERRRLVLVEWGLGLALAAFALALPIEVLVGRGVQLVAELGAGRWSGPHFIPSLLAGLLGRAGLGAERAGFLLSALALALCVPLAGALGRRLGASARLATLGALVLGLTPVVWHAARLPGPGAPALAACLALAGALLGDRRERRVLVLATLAPLVDLTLAWLLPAVFLGSLGRGTRVGRRRALYATAVPLAVLALVHALAAGIDPGRQLEALLPELARALLALDGRSAPWSWLALTGLGALGLGLAGLIALAVVQRGEEEQPPPAWIWAWCLGPLLAHGVGVLPPVWLAAPALLGGLDLLARVPEGKALRALALGGLAQACLLTAGGMALRAADPLADWRARADATLRGGDLFLGADGDRLHLARMRYGLPALDLRLHPDHWLPAALAASAAGSRLVLDGTSAPDDPQTQALLRDLAPGLTL